MKFCCICKKVIENEGFMTTLTNDIFAHGLCFMELIPNSPENDLTKTMEERREQRKIEVDKVVQKLIMEHQK